MHRHLKPILPAPTPSPRPPSPVAVVPKNRPLRSCTRCRQHKTKCDAVLRKPLPCSHCSRKGLVCELDLAIPPQRSNILKKLSTQINDLTRDLNFLLEKDSNSRQVLKHIGVIIPPMSPPKDSGSEDEYMQESENEDEDTFSEYKQFVNNRSPTPLPIILPQLENNRYMKEEDDYEPEERYVHNQQQEHYQADQKYYSIQNFHLSLAEIEYYFEVFSQNYLPYLPIPINHTPTQTYHKSHLLFWCIILTASLSNKDASVYNQLTPLVKDLLIETCWYTTPRSSHIIHALLIIATWPLPSWKYMDDSSYRLLGLSKSISLQLGLHRGKFIHEFSQGVIGKNINYRNLLWAFNFINNGFWCDYFGIPELFSNDYIINLTCSKSNESTEDHYISALIRLIITNNKILNLMGNSITTTGLINFNERFLQLSIWETILSDFKYSPNLPPKFSNIIAALVIFIKLKLFTFAFFPNTPINDLCGYIDKTINLIYQITDLFCSLVGSDSILTLPIHIRFPIEFVCYLTMRLINYAMTPKTEYERLRDCLARLLDILQLKNCSDETKSMAGWSISNDVSRTVRILKNFEIALLTRPSLILSQKYIINNIKTHLTSSIIYETIFLSHYFEIFQNTDDEPVAAEEEETIYDEPDWKFFGLELTNLDDRNHIAKLCNPTSMFMGNLVHYTKLLMAKDTDGCETGDFGECVDFLISNLNNFKKLVESEKGTDNGNNEFF